MLWASFVRSPEANAKIVSIDTSAAIARDGHHRRLHRRGHVRSRRPAADGLGASRGRGQQPRALAARPWRRQARRRPGRGRHRRWTATPCRTPTEDVLVEYETLPAIVDPEAAIAGAPFVHESVRHQQGPRVDAGRRGRRGGLRRGRRDRRAPRGQPPDRRRADRVPRRDRRLPRRLADAVHVDPGPALRPPVHGAAARHGRGSRARDRARGRRRLRPEAAGLRRGAAGLLGVTQARPSR